MTEKNWQHWSLERDAQRLAWLTLDRRGSAVNALSADVMAELGEVLDILEKEPPAGLIIRSGKNTGFVVGADIDEFSRMGDEGAAQAIVARGWNLFERLAAVRYPTLALIQGHCLGGGLELALACRYRIVIDDPGTGLGLPEVMLGIFPGWGGIKRLPRLIGAQAALDMMLTGRRVNPRRAAALGLVDARVPKRVGEAAARQWVLSGKPVARVRGWRSWLGAWPLNRLVRWQVKRQLESKDPQGHYPAPRAILALWAHHDGNALQAPALVDSILASQTARNLLRVFHLQERLKSYGKTDGQAPVRHVHVVGAGVMGGDIAVWCALQGLRVTLQDQSMKQIAPVLARAAKLYRRKLKDRRREQAALDRLVPDLAGHGAARADLVIEAISENLEAKQSLYRQLEARMRPDALLATNTSSLSLEALRSCLQRPQRLIGIHFFNPVARMPLVEVVSTRDGDAEHQQAAARACGFVAQIGKLPLPVRSAPGFLVNAALAPYMLEAMRYVDQGVSPAGIDAAMTAFGMPMGPIELIDTVGLDVALAAGRQLAPDAEPPRCLQQKIDSGKLGRKSGEGFYPWRDGKATKPAAGQVPADLAARLARTLADAARRQVDTGVVADADLADAGMIFGTGYAPFTGGPLRHQGMLSP
ncbi:short chain enoyl-CoA hydratase /3-hydroxyacyl-CoA dehydrogenase [Kerstersia gyiorum]|uniref:Short chain enoyl-CoA hydratase /3-hydroxyacyl-CoA dehydrogenase n=1 Tax=Kerstersia gyiorum TaxID=206506 RepID=A0A4Q7MGC5_9BURK|nr:3-hydroxyacyl-CoA dehydrogenase NAD-binding domain-containing protein [Kerstersia gyiorum]KAB0542577.1 enoyl-CoA hydratase [Kerstersia gyiorum]MCR4160462.1 3-hydroxyacyl-CoA dehydrogenase NAD-binding domain-containing protein [Kerstersia gyiorum]RZS66657.1 short chain enoyl-CoA hydratase /3-hydroxyacyl-CoA dehydrogenase [Kerstersia gyiorum]